MNHWNWKQPTCLYSTPCPCKSSSLLNSDHCFPWAELIYTELCVICSFFSMHCFPWASSQNVEQISILFIVNSLFFNVWSFRYCLCREKADLLKERDKTINLQSGELLLLLIFRVLLYFILSFDTDERKWQIAKLPRPSRLSIAILL